MNRLGANLMAVVLAAVTAAVAVVVKPWIGQASSALLIVLGVAIAGATFGMIPALLAAIVAFLIYNFFLAEPSMIFTFTTREDLAPFIAFSLTALVTGALAGRLKDREQAAHAANLRLASLLNGSRALQAAVTAEDVEDVAARLATAYDGKDRRDDRSVDAVPFPRIDVPSHRQIRPLITTSGLTGPREPYFAALDALVSIARERAALSGQVAEALTATKSESLKTALLASVSHDIRTPLASIVASASSLAEYGDNLPPETRASLLATIVSESERLDRFTGNLLELSRLRFGSHVPGLILDPADVFAAAVNRVGQRLMGRLTGRVDNGRFLVCADTQLFEVAIANLLHNAVIHAPDGPIEVHARRVDNCFELMISDHGPGIPEVERKVVFEKFQRLDSTRPGSGLGLAIAKGFVGAASGTVELVDRIDGETGACVIVRLPLADEHVGASDD